MICNGRLMARRVVDLSFKNNEPIISIYVKNGDFVKKGDKIAAVDDFVLNHKLNMALETLEKSKLELQNLLIGQSYSLKDSADIPASVMKTVRVKSGYDNALSAYAMSKREKNESVLIAPFDGVIANLYTTELNPASQQQPFCRIIDQNSLEASFTVLESELNAVKCGNKVTVNAFSVPGEIITGTISEINPLVEESGMVRVRASVKKNKNLFEGMNVRVKINHSVPSKFVIPKSAVVVRKGKYVVFTYNEGKAIWNYIDILFENSTDYAIESATIHEGDLIITEGNINLSNDATVKVL